MTEAKTINVALQGGGAHGAFTWGVLETLLADERVDIHGVTGTSAGAMNAAVMMTGYERGGTAGAIAALEAFWRDVASAARFSPFHRTLFDRALGNWSLDASPTYLAYDLASRLISPAVSNPFDINPLRTLVEAHVDFDLLTGCKDLQLFVAATNVWTGKPRIFSHTELSADALMASACIPELFGPVLIDGVPYWDGGFMGNPPLYPLFYRTKVQDLVIVQINPIERRQTPITAREIVNRMNEITMNSSLLRELRAVRFVQNLIAEGKLSDEDYMSVRVHRVASQELTELGSSSKMNGEWAFLRHLRGIGNRAAQHWLDTCWDDVGHRATIDLGAEIN